MRRSLTIPSVLLLLCLFSAVVAAEPENDIKLIIDVSGSMKKNDPDNLRRPAVNLLMNLLPENARAGVWLFGDEIETLVPYGAVTQSFKARAIQSSQAIHSRGLLTNIGGALEQSLLQGKRGGKAILLSDGMVDLGPDEAKNLAEQDRIRRELIPQLVQNQAEVHTVALSANADRELLHTIAERTGGLYEVAKTADDLTRIFLRLFDDAVIQDRLPMDGGRFLVDSKVEEFTLLAFREAGSAPIQVKSPNDQYYLADDHPDFISWYHDAGFELITVPRPLEGEWRLFADEDSQNRVTVLSNLKLDVNNLENTLHEASFPQLEARFLQGDTVIVDPEFLALMDLQLIVLTPAGKRVAKPLSTSENGVFKSDLDVFAEPGRYRISVNVDGKTFQREVVQEVEYGSPARIVFNAETRLVTVEPVAAGLLEDDLQMIARLEADNGSKKLIPMSRHTDVWQANLDDLEKGNYQLTVSVKGVARTGQDISFSLDTQTIVLSTDVVTEAPEIVEEEGWTQTEWGLGIGAGVTNLLLAAFAIWYFRRRRKDVIPDDSDEIEELLKHAPAGPSSDGEETDITAVLEEAESLRSTAGKSAEPEPVEGMSDIVDAWGDEPSTSNEGTTDSEDVSPVTDTSSEETLEIEAVDENVSANNDLEANPDETKELGEIEAEPESSADLEQTEAASEDVEEDVHENDEMGTLEEPQVKGETASG